MQPQECSTTLIPASLPANRVTIHENVLNAAMLSPCATVPTLHAPYTIPETHTFSLRAGVDHLALFHTIPVQITVVHGNAEIDGIRLGVERQWVHDHGHIVVETVGTGNSVGRRSRTAHQQLQHTKQAQNAIPTSVPVVASPIGTVLPESLSSSAVLPTHSSISSISSVTSSNSSSFSLPSPAPSHTTALPTTPSTCASHVTVRLSYLRTVCYCGPCAQNSSLRHTLLHDLYTPNTRNTTSHANVVNEASAAEVSTSNTLSTMPLHTTAAKALTAVEAHDNAPVAHVAAEEAVGVHKCASIVASAAVDSPKNTSTGDCEDVEARADAHVALSEAYGTVCWPRGCLVAVQEISPGESGKNTTEKEQNSFPDHLQGSILENSVRGSSGVSARDGTVRHVGIWTSLPVQHMSIDKDTHHGSETHHGSRHASNGDPASVADCDAVCAYGYEPEYGSGWVACEEVCALVVTREFMDVDAVQRAVMAQEVSRVEDTSIRGTVVEVAGAECRIGEANEASVGCRQVESVEASGTEVGGRRELDPFTGVDSVAKDTGSLGEARGSVVVQRAKGGARKQKEGHEGDYVFTTSTGEVLVLTGVTVASTSVRKDDNMVKFMSLDQDASVAERRGSADVRMGAGHLRSEVIQGRTDESAGVECLVPRLIEGDADANVCASSPGKKRNRRKERKKKVSVVESAADPTEDSRVSDTTNSNSGVLEAASGSNASDAANMNDFSVAVVSDSTQIDVDVSHGDATPIIEQTSRVEIPLSVTKDTSKVDTEPLASLAVPPLHSAVPALKTDTAPLPTRADSVPPTPNTETEISSLTPQVSPAIVPSRSKLECVPLTALAGPAALTAHLHGLASPHTTIIVLCGSSTPTPATPAAAYATSPSTAAFTSASTSTSASTAMSALDFAQIPLMHLFARSHARNSLVSVLDLNPLLQTSPAPTHLSCAPDLMHPPSAASRPSTSLHPAASPPSTPLLPVHIAGALPSLPSLAIYRGWSPHPFQSPRAPLHSVLSAFQSQCFCAKPPCSPLPHNDWLGSVPSTFTSIRDVCIRCFCAQVRVVMTALACNAECVCLPYGCVHACSTISNTTAVMSTSPAHTGTASTTDTTAAATAVTGTTSPTPGSDSTAPSSTSTYSSTSTLPTPPHRHVRGRVCPPNTWSVSLPLARDIPLTATALQALRTPPTHASTPHPHTATPFLSQINATAPPHHQQHTPGRPNASPTPSSSPPHTPTLTHRNPPSTTTAAAAAAASHQHCPPFLSSPLMPSTSMAIDDVLIHAQDPENDADHPGNDSFSGLPSLDADDALGRELEAMLSAAAGANTATRSTNAPTHSNDTHPRNPTSLIQHDHATTSNISLQSGIETSRGPGLFPTPESVPDSSIFRASLLKPMPYVLFIPLPLHAMLQGLSQGSTNTHDVSTNMHTTTAVRATHGDPSAVPATAAQPPIATPTPATASNTATAAIAAALTALPNVTALVYLPDPRSPTLHSDIASFRSIVGYFPNTQAILVSTPTFRPLPPPSSLSSPIHIKSVVARILATQNAVRMLDSTSARAHALLERLLLGTSHLLAAPTIAILRMIATGELVPLSRCPVSHSPLSPPSFPASRPSAPHACSAHPQRPLDSSSLNSQCPPAHYPQSQDPLGGASSAGLPPFCINSHNAHTHDSTNTPYSSQPPLCPLLCLVTTTTTPTLIALFFLPTSTSTSASSVPTHTASPSLPSTHLTRARSQSTSRHPVHTHVGTTHSTHACPSAAACAPIHATSAATTPPAHGLVFMLAPSTLCAPLRSATSALCVYPYPCANEGRVPVSGLSSVISQVNTHKDDALSSVDMRANSSYNDIDREHDTDERELEPKTSLCTDREEVDVKHSGMYAAMGEAAEDSADGEKCKYSDNCTHTCTDHDTRTLSTTSSSTSSTTSGFPPASACLPSLPSPGCSSPPSPGCSSPPSPCSSPSAQSPTTTTLAASSACVSLPPLQWRPATASSLSTLLTIVSTAITTLPLLLLPHVPWALHDLHWVNAVNAGAHGDAHASTHNHLHNSTDPQANGTYNNAHAVPSSPSLAATPSHTAHTAHTATSSHAAAPVFAVPLSHVFAEVAVDTTISPPPDPLPPVPAVSLAEFPTLSVVSTPSNLEKWFSRIGPSEMCCDSIRACLLSQLHILRGVLEDYIHAQTQLLLQAQWRHLARVYSARTGVQVRISPETQMHIHTTSPTGQTHLQTLTPASAPPPEILFALSLLTPEPPEALRGVLPCFPSLLASKRGEHGASISISTSIRDSVSTSTFSSPACLSSAAPLSTSSSTSSSSSPAVGSAATSTPSIYDAIDPSVITVTPTLTKTTLAPSTITSAASLTSGSAANIISNTTVVMGDPEMTVSGLISPDTKGTNNTSSEMPNSVALATVLSSTSHDVTDRDPYSAPDDDTHVDTTFTPHDTAEEADAATIAHRRALLLSPYSHPPRLRALQSLELSPDALLTCSHGTRVWPLPAFSASLAALREPAVDAPALVLQDIALPREHMLFPTMAALCGYTVPEDCTEHDEGVSGHAGGHYGGSHNAGTGVSTDIEGHSAGTGVVSKLSSLPTHTTTNGGTLPEDAHYTAPDALRDVFAMAGNLAKMCLALVIAGVNVVGLIHLMEALLPKTQQGRVRVRTRTDFDGNGTSCGHSDCDCTLVEQLLLPVVGNSDALAWGSHHGTEAEINVEVEYMPSVAPTPVPVMVIFGLIYLISGCYLGERIYSRWVDDFRVRVVMSAATTLAVSPYLLFKEPFRQWHLFVLATLALTLSLLGWIW